jgi:hypothetical protein
MRRRWLSLVTIGLVIITAMYYSKRENIQISKTNTGSAPAGRPPTPPNTNEPSNVPPAPPLGPWHLRSPAKVQCTQPQALSPQELPAPQLDSSRPGIPQPSALDPSGYPLGIFCPPETTLVRGECISNRALPPGLSSAK